MIAFSRGILLFFLCLAPVFQADRVLAVVRHVPGDITTIQEGLDASAVGDTVILACGTYFEYNIIMKSGVTLMGESTDVACVVIDAQNQGRVLDCVDLIPLTRIIGITFTNGFTTEGWFTALGGGIRCLNSNVAITKCSFQNNNARIGAGVGASESELEIIDCLFDSNAAIDSIWSAGGALWARDCSGTIQNCQVTSNTAFSDDINSPGDGGGFFFNNTDLNVSNCQFIGNSTGAGAGAFYSVTNDSSIFTNCDFEANVAGNGGAVYFEFAAAAQLINCNFLENTASAGGAIVSFNDSFPVLINCLFDGNQATQWSGGAVETWDSEVTITGCHFMNNIAQSSGGGAFFGSSTVDISNSTFCSNTAGDLGGAIRTHYSTITAIGSTLFGNSAPSGGGIYCGINSFATIDHCIIASSTNGESLAGLGNDFALISCSDFYGNQAGDWVGIFADQQGVSGNFSADPRFCDSDLNDFSLDLSSPCATTGGGCDLVGAHNIGCSISAIPEVPSSSLEILYADNYPNPFNPATTIRFELTRAGPTKIIIYDVAGRLINTLLDSTLPALNHEVKWFGRDDQQQEVAAGIYFYQITSGSAQITGRMALIK